MNKTIAVLGATGSVGTQAIDVARARGYKVDLLTSNRQVSETEALARELKPKAVAMADESAARDLKNRLSDTSVKVYAGEEGIVSAIGEGRFDTVINSILGEAGLRPTLATIEAGHRLALANKESLVIAGDIVMSRVKARGIELIPVDSEHSAIFQSLMSGKRSEIKRILLTASGGPFFAKSREQLSRVTLSDTLAHPTWKMGRKITVDSATLMNKGFEVIEAVHLFGVPAEKVSVLIHRESILHSAVEFADNTVIGEMSSPDMRMCVQYAVDYPNRMPSHTAELDLFKVGSLTFARPDTDAFPLLSLASRAIPEGGAVPAVMNAADECAVDAFLRERISFTDISDIVTEVVDGMSSYRTVTDLDGIISADREARRRAGELISRLSV